jgi:hypothetical protein
MFSKKSPQRRARKNITTPDESGVWEPAALASVRSAIAHGRVPAVGDLKASDRDWGHAVFDLVAAQYGAQCIRRYLNARRGRSGSGADAIRAAFGVPKAEFDAAFRGYEKAFVAGR